MDRDAGVEVSTLIEAVLREQELTFDRSGPTHMESFVVQLPGEHKLNTTCMLTVGRYGLRVEAFVCRHVEENLDGVYAFLLRRNRSLYGVAYTIDRLGDIYLVGRLAADLVTAEELDRLLGQVLAAADGDFNVILELGFAGSIRREWDWRTSRGESVSNLKAFSHLVGPNR